MKKMSAIRLWAISLLSMLCFGWSWAQSYSANFSNATGATNSYGPATITLNGQQWKASACYFQKNEFRLGNNDTDIPIDTKFTNAGITSDGNASTIEMLWDIHNITSVSFSSKGKFGTIQKSHLLESIDGGNSYTIVATSTETSGTFTITYTPEKTVSSARYAIATEGKEPRITLDNIEILAEEAPSCEAPTSLTAVPGVASVELSWTAPANAPANGYNITLTPTAGGDAINKTTEAGITTLTVNDLGEETEYNWTVASNCGDENTSEAVSGAAFTTLAADKPGVSTTTTSVDKSIMIDGSTTETINFTSANITSNLAISIKSKDGQGTAGYTTETSEITSDAAASFSITVNSAASLAAGVYQDTLVISHDGADLCKVVLNLEVSKYKTPKAVITPNGGGFFKSVSVSMISSLDNSEIRYTTDETVPTADSTLYEQAINITTSSTLKALVFPGEDNAAKYEAVNDSLAIAAFTIVDATPVELPLAFNSGKNAITGSGLTQYGLGSDYKDEAKLKFDDEGDFVVAAFTSAPGSLVFDMKKTADSLNIQFDVQSSANGTDWTTVKTFTGADISTDITEKRIETLGDTVRFVRWTYVKKVTGTNVGIGNITIYKQTSDPILNISKTNMNLASEISEATTDSVKVTGKNLTEAVSVNIVKGGDEFGVSSASIAAADIMAENGYQLKITYTPADKSKDTAWVVLAHGDMKDTLYVYGKALVSDTVKTIAEIYEDYENIDKEQVYVFSGKAVVTHMDENIYNGNTTQRVWIQDTNMDNGASILVYAKNFEMGYGNLKVGDVVSNFSGKLDIYNNLLEFVPTTEVKAVVNNHKLAVDTVTIEELNANKLKYQSALVHLEGVSFTKNGKYEGGKNYDLVQGEDTIVFRTDYRQADYIGEDIHVGVLNITGIICQFYNDMQITARNLNDFQVSSEAAFVVDSKVEIETILNQSTTKELVLKGQNLTDSVFASVEGEHISVSPLAFHKDSVMSQKGVVLNITFDGKVAADTATVTLVSGELKDTIMVYASAEDFIEVANLAELRKGEQGKLYKVKSEVVLTAMDSYRNYKFIQDSTAGMLIDDANGLVTTEYEIGNGITGVYGRLASFSNQLQLAMIGNLPEASSEKVAIDTIEVSIAELNGNMEKYCSRLVRINGLSMTIDTVKEWASNQDHYAADGEDTINIRTFIRNGNFVGDTIPAEFDLVGIAGIYKTSAQVSPRFKTDIIVKEGEGGDTGVYNQWMVADINTNLYPNPSNGEFTVEMDQDAQVEIFNAMGVRVQAMNLTAGKHDVRINQSGVYFVRFSNGKASSVKRVIIR